MALIDTCPDGRATCRGCTAFKLDDGKPHCGKHKRGSGLLKVGKVGEVPYGDAGKLKYFLAKLSEGDAAAVVESMGICVFYADMVGYHLPLALSADPFELGMYASGRVDLMMFETSFTRVEDRKHPFFPAVFHMMKSGKKELVNDEAIQYRVPVSVELPRRNLEEEGVHDETKSECEG